MYYGAIDESGSPGAAKGSEPEFVSLVLVLFKDKEAADEANEQVSRLKRELGKSRDYEFHAKDDNKQIKHAFLDLLNKLDFTFFFVYLRKTPSRRDATYTKLAAELVSKISSSKIRIKSIKMDNNNRLFECLRKQAKMNNVFLKCKQVKSHNYATVQIADYIVNIATRELSGKKVDPIWKQIKKSKRIK
ncbi:MAG: DUF3800 domain-containing protein [Candidatus Saccharibacteria bacterium]|nr:DUF3800 domain-containing protein [Candidatus Saccharibacteria bacterium]